MVFRAALVLLTLIGFYVGYTIVHFKWMYHSIENPKASFLEQGNEKSDLIFVEFLSYGCGYCRELSPVFKELLEKRPDIKYIIRPALYGDESLQRTTRIVIAAGLQDKFWELHNAVLEYPEVEIPDSFIEETSDLYGIDYEQLLKDADGKKVKKIIDHNMSTISHAGIYSVPSIVIGKNIYQITDENLPELQDFLNLLPSPSN